MQWIKKLINTIKYKWGTRFNHFFLLPKCPVGHKYIEMSVAGTNHENRDRALNKCMLHEQVTLHRDPQNINDSNAIKIIAKGSDHIGFVPRLKAVHLAEHMDGIDKPLKAFISSLYHATSSERTSASIVLCIPDELFSKLRHTVVNLRYEKGSDGCATVFLDCEDECLRLIIKIFETNDIKYSRHSTALKPASNGLMYKWYIALTEDVGETRIRETLKHELKLFSPDDQFNEYANIFEPENKKLREEIEKLKDEISNFKKEATSKPKPISSPKLKKEFEKLLGFIFPEVEFLDKSFSAMIEKYKDLEQIFRFIRDIAANQNLADYKPEKFHAAPGWFEIHISGCEHKHNAGRLYYKCKTTGNNKWRVLVSCKKEQEMDKELLKKY